MDCDYACGRTLLLDNGYQPVATIGWQRAISMLTRGKIEVIESYDREVRSFHLVIRMPAVVRLVNFFRRRPQRVKFSRQNIMARDRWCCQYCGTKVKSADMTMDHVVPRAQGGRTEWENIVTCCGNCNAKKADRTPKQAGMRLRMEPARPSWVPVFSIQLSGSIPEQWASYVYWTTALEVG